MLAFGISPQDAQAMLGDVDISEDFYVEPDNWESISVFLALSTQWNILAGMSGVQYQGLKYEVIQPVMRMMGIKKQSQVFDDVRTMENSALSILNERV